VLGFISIGSSSPTVCSVHTGLFAAATPWLDPVNFKSKLLHLKDAVPLIILQRDRGEGRVTCNSMGLPKISYELDKHDKKSMVTGVLRALEILEKSGSDYISTAHNDDTGIVCGKDELSFLTYLNEVERRGIEKHRMGIFSAHQMGSCRMGTSPNTSVVDQNGESWECEDLYIMDASIFPTASGANPMITTLTMSHMLSIRLKNKLQDSCSK
jgi:long-chain-alcohol oxidase